MYILFSYHKSVINSLYDGEVEKCCLFLHIYRLEATVDTRLLLKHVKAVVTRLKIVLNRSHQGVKN